MTVRELNRDRLDDLKTQYVFDQFAKNGKSPSWTDIMMANKIPDEIIFEEYDGIDFVEEDFFCSEEE